MTGAALSERVRFQRVGPGVTITVYLFIIIRRCSESRVLLWRLKYTSTYGMTSSSYGRSICTRPMACGSIVQTVSDSISRVIELWRAS